MKLPGLSSLVPLAFAVWDRVRPPTRDAADYESERWARNAALVVALDVVRGRWQHDEDAVDAFVAVYQGRAAAARARLTAAQRQRALELAEPILIEAGMQRLEAGQRYLAERLAALRSKGNPP